MAVSNNAQDESTESNAAQSDTLVAQANAEESIPRLPGQPQLPADAEDASTDEDNPMTAYRKPADSMTEGDKVANADWNRNTREGAIPATRVDEPDRTLGNS